MEANHQVPKEQKLTEDEAKLYDRQIRLWGVDGQQRFGGGKILMITIEFENRKC